jgi:hypothetical protein
MPDQFSFASAVNRAFAAASVWVRSFWRVSIAVDQALRNAAS